MMVNHAMSNIMMFIISKMICRFSDIENVIKNWIKRLFLDIYGLSRHVQKLSADVKGLFNFKGLL